MPTPLSRRRLILVALLTATALLAALLLAPAAGAAGLRIVSPHNDRFFARGPVSVEVRAPDSAHSVTAKLEGKQVKAALKKVKPGLWRGKLAAGLLRKGANHLVVSAATAGSRRYDAIRFSVGKRQRKYLTVGVPKGGRSARVVRVRIGGARPSRIGATLNGKRLRWPFFLWSGRDLSLRLGADDGLRFGSNRLKVFAARSDGTFDVERRTLFVPRSSPLVGAGRDRRTVAGARLRLDGRSTRAALGPRARLHYRWRIVRKPAGSKAKLLRASSPRPLLKTDKPGRYRVRLTATESGVGATGKPFARRAPDVITIGAGANVPPIGMPIETMVFNGGSSEETVDTAIRVGSKTYWMGMPKGNQVQAVILDRETLEVKFHASYVGTQRNAEELEAQIKKYGSTALVAISNPDVLPESGVSLAFVPIVKSLGVPIELIQLGHSGWSVVGVPGSKGGGYLGAGQSYNPDGVADLRGSLSGYLQEGIGASTGFAYVPASRLDFDTKAGGVELRNTIKIGSAEYDSGPLPACAEAGKQPAGGFQVEVVTSESLRPTGARTFTTNGCGGPADEASLKDMASFIGSIKIPGEFTNEGPKLVFVQSIGSAYDSVGDAWNELATELAAVGATASVFAEARESYALVGNLGAGGLGPKEASQSLSGKPARITGVLEPTRLNLFVPMLSSPAGEPGWQLSAIAFQPHEAWPFSQSKEGRLALQYAAEVLELEPPTPGVSCYLPERPDVRSEYCDATYESSWAGFASTVEGKGWVSKHGFSKETWREVKTELAGEFRKVQDVWTLTGLLKESFNAGTTSAQARLKQIALEIEEAIKPPPHSETAGWWLELVANVASIVSYYNFGIEGEIVQKATGTLSGGLFIAAQMIFGPEGTPTAEEFKLKSDEIAVQLAETYLASIKGLDLTAELLVSDYGKLTAASEQGLLGISTKDLGKMETMIGPGSQQWSWENLLPVAYEAVALEKGETNNNPLPANASEFVCGYYEGGAPTPETYKPFPKAPKEAQLHSSGPSPALGVLVLKGSKLPEHDGKKVSPRTPPEGLLKRLFEPVTENEKTTGMGLEAPWFWRTTFGYPGKETRVVNECP
jgi:hypothetical protein